MDDPPATAPPRPSTALCLTCGLCCNGVLFGQGAAREDELDWMAASGVVLELSGEKPQFRQPCPHSGSLGCAIYAERFHVCRSFRCALLRKLEAGTLSEGEAARLVAEVKGLIARDPEMATAAARRRSRGAGPPDRANGAATQAWLRAVAIDRFLDRHFRDKPVLLWSAAEIMSPDDPEQEPSQAQPGERPDP